MDTPRVVKILADLVAIPSVNPAYDPGSAGEAAMADHIEAWALGLGLPVSRLEVFPGRDNVHVRLQGPESGPTLLFEAHTDTVGVDGMAAPFQPEIRDVRMFGRGTCDTKGSLAAMMAAIEELFARRNELPCSVELLAGVDEETSGTGVRAHVVAGNRADGAVVGEPTELRVINEHNGCIRGEIVVTGKAAHTSVASEGVNAIDGMADTVLALHRLNADLTQRAGGPAANGSFTVSLISGGTGINIVPERCVIGYDRRTVPGDAAEDVIAEIDAVLATVRASRPELVIERCIPALVDNALQTDVTAPIVVAASAVAVALGLDGTPARVPYGSDASKLQVIGGIPTIVFGPGSIALAHAAGEYVPLADLIAATAFYRDLALSFGR